MKGRVFEFGYRAAAGTHSGMRRGENQDEVMCHPELGLFAVSDGMGGLSGGGATSALLKKALPAFLRAPYEALKKNPAPESAAASLIGCIQAISDGIYQRLNAGRPTAFGATLCGAWLVGRHAVFFNLGDSRGYVLRRDQMSVQRITADHRHSRNVLSRFVGMEKPAVPDVFPLPVAPGDRLLICSDGLYNMVNERHLAEIMRAAQMPERAVAALIGAANDAGGTDNIAAVCVEIAEQ